MQLPAQRLNEDISLAPQLGPAEMALAAAAGFRSVINNRPDFEAGPDQPTSADIEAAARAAGLEYAYLPVAPGLQTPEEARTMADLMTRLPKPVLAFCRSGNRSGRLYAMARALGG